MRFFSLLSLTLATTTITVFSSGVFAANVFRTTQRMSGFSPDSRHYIHLESSRDTGPEIPKAHLQIVNVRSNACVEDGCLETEYDKDSYSVPLKAAEDDLLKRTLTLRQTLKMTALKTGIRLPVISKAKSPDGTESVTVRLNKPGETLQIFLQQRHIPSIVRGGTDDVDRAAMRLYAVRYLNNINTSKLTVGDINKLRDAVINYSIREVRLSPNGKNIVVLLDMNKTTFDGVLRATLVQSFPL